MKKDQNTTDRRDPKRDKTGWKAQLKQARQNKSKRKSAERGWK